MTATPQSKSAFTDAELAKLPKWAQVKVKDLTRERDIAVRELTAFLDDQTPSPVSTMEMLCIGESQGPSIKTRYIQANDVRFSWHGVELEVRLRDGGSMHNNCIQLSWHSEKRMSEHVAMVPASFNCVELITKENMR